MKSLQFLSNLPRRLRRNRRGTVAVVAAIATPIVVGFAGLGVEVSTWHTAKRTLQTAADSAAVSGTLEKAFGANATGIRTAALREAGRNGFVSQNQYDALVNSPPTSGAYQGDPTAVEVVLSRPQSPLLARVFRPGNVNIGARAVASLKQIGQACILALDPSVSGAVTNQGSTVVNVAGCVVAANSSAASAITTTGNANVTAQSLWTVGGYTRGGSSTLTLAQPATTKTWPLADPFAGTPIPNPGSCTHTSARYQNQTVTINPGTYCLGIAIGANARVTFNPGVYIINRGDFAVNAQAIVDCNCTGGNGVTIILTSSTNASQIGSVIINGGATVDLKAPSYAGAPYRGLLFVQDPRADDGCGGLSLVRFQGGSAMKLTGALYFPAGEVKWNGNNTTTSCVQVVARRVTFIGNSAFDVSGCAAAGVQPIKVTAARFVE